MPTTPKAPKSKRAARVSRNRRGHPATLEAFFGPSGPLTSALPGYEMRTEQIAVAEAIEQAMQAGTPCLAEAGTGVGKSLAYLIPAVRAALRGKKTVISTHTINLQNQLIEKDIPLVLGLFPELEERVTATLMKGRANFLCKMEMENARGNLLLMTDPDFRRIQRWAAREDCTGDVADLNFTFSAWNELTSTPETCRAQECPLYKGCHYYRMRWAAMESNLIIVNHALFFSDLALRHADPNAGILPEYDYVVFDEAHHLEDVATKTFGIEFGSRRLTNLMDRLRHIRGLDLEKSRLQTLEDLNASLFLPFLQAGKSEFYFDDALQDEARDKTEEWTGLTCNSIAELQKDLLEIAKDEETLRDRLEGIARMCGRAREELHQLFFQQDENAIRWADVIQAGRGGKKEPRVTLHLTPILVAKILQEALWNRLKAPKSAILISATLANSGGFTYQRSRLGVPEEALECIVGSPFDFKRQAMLYVPGHLPAPAPVSVTAYTDRVVAELERVLRLTAGRAFLLFTSRAMLNTVYERLSGTLPFPLFKQGDMPPAKLLDAFKASGDGCLLGAQTFWEGVDIQGDALSCVIIDRLPFAVPDSPVTKARTQAIVDAGGDWFRDYAVPQAQIRLKQGFGRLIRTRADRGIVCILDSRLITKDYGAEFVRYLPPASRASKWPRVERFWRGELTSPADAQGDGAAVSETGVTSEAS
jgi:ATP-dependent DNA helicase DinG